MVTNAHHRASLASWMFASGDRLSNWSIKTLAEVSTSITVIRVMKSAYELRFLITSSNELSLAPAAQHFHNAARRLSRARRKSPVMRRIPSLGIEPRRSSQPRRWRKYSRRGRDPVRL